MAWAAQKCRPRMKDPIGALVMIVRTDWFATSGIGLYHWAM